MKNIKLGLGLALVTSALSSGLFAGSYDVWAKAGGSTGNWGQSTGINIIVPPSASYSYHMFVTGSAGGNTYVSFSGAGVTFYDSLSSSGAKTGNAAFPSTGQVNGSIYANVTALFVEASETEFTVIW